MQVMAYTHQGVVQVELDVMGKVSPELVQVCVVLFVECEHITQSTLDLHFLNPVCTCLLDVLGV